MRKRWFLPTLALIGAVIGLIIAFWSQREVPTPPILYPPPTSPYVTSIAGAGIVEASSENIAVGSPFVNTIEAIYVLEGDEVKKGDPLFKLDTRSLEAQKLSAEASVKAAEVIYEDKKRVFSFYERLNNKFSVSEQAYVQAKYAVDESYQELLVSKENLHQVEVDIERSLITSPIDALILQVNYHVGEVVSTLPTPTQPFISNLTIPIILLGAIDPLYIRIDIDEDDAWRYEPGAPATAFVRGNSRIHFPLKFVRVEPYILPKVSFTGATTERVDTRVLQVLYSFEKGSKPVYLGQILDIFIDEPLKLCPGSLIPEDASES